MDDQDYWVDSVTPLMTPVARRLSPRPRSRLNPAYEAMVIQAISSADEIWHVTADVASLEGRGAGAGSGSASSEAS
ncbi:hypothetical protein V491_06523 [Pseudogymnoascus sp. VKM F-3775]|nr:hypothetical protein V491_06523 [Pseudogymnoascus sp. VKM F-3775]